jgi:hypothetical protein
MSNKLEDLEELDELLDEELYEDIDIEEIEEESKPTLTREFPFPPKKAEKLVRHEHYHFRDTDLKVTLNRGMKGQYGWEITVVGNTLADILALLKEADEKLRQFFAPMKGGEQ